MSVDGAFARATVGRGKVGAAYLKIHNPTDAPDRLVGASTEIAKRAELHTHLHENGIMKMRPIEGVEVPANGMVMLKPGGDHVMMMGLSAPLKKGELFPLALTFEKAGEVVVMVKVGAVGASEAEYGSSKHETGKHETKHKH